MRYLKDWDMTDRQLEHRRRLRGVDSSRDGLDELFNLFHEMGMFRVIPPEELITRNKAVLKAEEMGLLDEDVIRKTLEELLTSGKLDVLEDSKKKEADKRKKNPVAF